MKCGVIILAAGKGTRMKSDLPKVAHIAAGQPLVTYPVDVALSVGASPVCIVVGHGADIVKDILKARPVVFAMQNEQLGTGHAVMQAQTYFGSSDIPVIILYGDVPLVTVRLIEELYELYVSTSSAVTLVSTILEDPAGYGRVLRTGEKIVIIEDKDASPEQKKCREINAGIYIASSGFLFSALSMLKNDNSQREYYLTDIVKIAVEQGRKVTALCEPDSNLTLGVNSRTELDIVDQILKKRK